MKEKVSVEDNMIFQQIYDDFLSQYSGRVVLSHFGSFKQDFVNSLTEGLEHIMLNNDTPKMIVKRMFSIMIEELQNIRIHGEKNEIGKQIGHVMINEINDRYCVSFGNLIKRENVGHLSSYIDILNSLNEHEIKKKYLEVLEEGISPNKTGVGLGFITIIMKSKSSIQYQFVNYSKGLCYFEMRLCID